LDKKWKKSHTIQRATSTHTRRGLFDWKTLYGEWS